MSLANKISLGRILLVPGIVASLVYYSPSRDGLRYVALVLFVLGILSDAADGFVARSKRQQSQLGTILDPIADKFLILGTLISLSTIRGLPSWMRIPAWFNLIVISRDALLVTGTMLLFAFTGKISVQPNRLGKWTVVAQMAVIPAVLLNWPWKLTVFILAAAMTIISSMSYLRLGAKLLESR